MKIGPKYKIARRLGAAVFEKTQTQKYAVRLAKKLKSAKRSGKAKSDYGLGMTEKQKAKYFYGVTERQFSNYVEKAISKKGNSGELLVRLLESRLDNVVLKSGFAPTRRASRQMVSHGHMLVNGKIVTVPSYAVSIGDKISIREGSKVKALFKNIDERFKNTKLPAWIKLDVQKREALVDGHPMAQQSELLFKVGQVLEFYTR